MTTSGAASAKLEKKFPWLQTDSAKAQESFFMFLAEAAHAVLCTSIFRWRQFRRWRQFKGWRHSKGGSNFDERQFYGRQLKKPPFLRTAFFLPASRYLSHIHARQGDVGRQSEVPDHDARRRSVEEPCCSRRSENRAVKLAIAIVIARYRPVSGNTKRHCEE